MYLIELFKGVIKYIAVELCFDAVDYISIISKNYLSTFTG